MIKTAAVNGFEMQYDVFGQGEKTMVILPGLSLKSVMFSAEAVEAQYGSFTEKYTVYMFDVRKDIPDGYSLSDFAEDTAAVMTSLGIKDAYAFGASMGGMVSLMIASRYPELIKRLVVSSGVCRNADTYGTFTRWGKFVEARDKDGLVADMIDHIYSEDTLKAYRDTLISGFAVVTEEEMRRTGILIEAIRAYDAYDEAEKIQCPVFAVGSRGDRVFGDEGTMDIAFITNGRLYCYPRNFGHGVYDEDPDFGKRIISFFEPVPRPMPGM